jgi:hypothetical protein
MCPLGQKLEIVETHCPVPCDAIPLEHQTPKWHWPAGSISPPEPNLARPQTPRTASAHCHSAPVVRKYSVPFEKSVGNPSSLPISAAPLNGVTRSQHSPRRRSPSRSTAPVVHCAPEICHHRGKILCHTRTAFLKENAVHKLPFGAAFIRPDADRLAHWEV